MTAQFIGTTLQARVESNMPGEKFTSWDSEALTSTAALIMLLMRSFEDDTKGDSPWSVIEDSLHVGQEINVQGIERIIDGTLQFIRKKNAKVFVDLADRGVENKANIRTIAFILLCMTELKAKESAYYVVFRSMAKGMNSAVIDMLGAMKPSKIPYTPAVTDLASILDQIEGLDDGKGEATNIPGDQLSWEVESDAS